MLGVSVKVGVRFKYFPWSKRMLWTKATSTADADPFESAVRCSATACVLVWTDMIQTLTGSEVQMCGWMEF